MKKRTFYCFIILLLTSITSTETFGQQTVQLKFYDSKTNMPINRLWMGTSSITIDHIRQKKFITGMVSNEIHNGKFELPSWLYCLRFDDKVFHPMFELQPQGQNYRVQAKYYIGKYNMRYYYFDFSHFSGRVVNIYLNSKNTALDNRNHEEAYGRVKRTKQFNNHRLSIQGRKGTLVAKNIENLPYIDLPPGAYNVSVSGPGIKLWWKQRKAFKYVVLWEGNSTGQHLVDSKEPTKIVLSQKPFTRVFAFLIDVNNNDSSGELDVYFSDWNSNRKLHVDGKRGTLVADITSLPYIDLSPGTYNVNLSGSGIKLWWRQAQPFKYALLWEGNATGHHIVKSGELSRINLKQQPYTRVFGFLIDVNNGDSSGNLNVDFK